MSTIKKQEGAMVPGGERLRTLLGKCPLASSLRRCSGERSPESASARLTGMLKGGAAADAVGHGAAGPRPLGIPTGRRLLPARARLCRLACPRTRSLARARTGRMNPQTDAPALPGQVAASLRQSVRSSLLRPTLAQA